MLRGFLDNCVIRNSQAVRREWGEVLETINWGGQEFTLPIQRSHDRFPTEKFRATNPEAFRDAQSIGGIERLARWRLVRLFWHFELRWEFLARRKIDQGAVTITEQLEEAHCPLFYGRIVAEAFSKTDHQLEFLRGLRHPRFDEWKEASGVIAGSRRERNQLLDAFHLWTAEHNWCDYFVTMDYALIQTVARSHLKTAMRLAPPRAFLRAARLHVPAALFERCAWRIVGTDGCVTKR